MSCGHGPSASQRRLLESLLQRARLCLRHWDGRTFGGAGIHDLLALDANSYEAKSGALRLGARAGVPDRAAVVDTAAALTESFPVLAAQVANPDELLLPPEDWPRRIKAPFEHLDGSYKELVKRAVDAGLLDFASDSEGDEPVQYRGVARTLGGFAVPKDLREDRWIAPCEFLNAITDKRRLQPVAMPFLPQLGVLTTRRGRKVWVSKRDARHYFHVLRTTKQWQRFMRGPPVRWKGKWRWPRHRAWPMGYAGSAVVAQSVTETAAAAAGLPSSRRCLPGIPCPVEPPVWGAIIDDVWTIGCEGCEADGDTGKGWLHALDHEWSAIGVESHPKKREDEVLGTEVQGAYLHPDRHVMALQVDKEVRLISAALLVATSFAPGLDLVEKVVGRCGYAHSFRTVLRSVFEATYPWKHSARERRWRRVPMGFDVCIEFVLAALTLPLAQLDFQREWSDLVTASDAAPGGHGLAYIRLPVPEVQSWARVAAHRGDYGLLLQESHLQAPEERHRRLQGAILPLSEHRWATVARPGGWRHICLEESDAFVWHLEERIKRGEVARRGVHIGDNAAQVSSHAKGRSATRRMNARCRKTCALSLASDVLVFEVWERSKFNPADEPSSRYGVRAERSAAAQHRAGGARPPGAAPLGLPIELHERVLVFVHLFSGVRRSGDLHFWLEALCHQAGVRALVLSVDVRIDPRWDLLDDQVFSSLRELCWSGRVFGKHGGPVCATWSAARWIPPGPRPLRDRRRPYGLPGLSARERIQCWEGSEFWLRDLDLSRGVLAGGAALPRSILRTVVRRPTLPSSPRPRRRPSSRSSVRCQSGRTSAATGPRLGSGLRSSVVWRASSASGDPATTSGTTRSLGGAIRVGGSALQARRSIRAGSASALLSCMSAPSAVRKPH